MRAPCRQPPAPPADAPARRITNLQWLVHPAVRRLNGAFKPMTSSAVAILLTDTIVAGFTPNRKALLRNNEMRLPNQFPKQGARGLFVNTSLLFNDTNLMPKCCLLEIRGLGSVHT